MTLKDEIDLKRKIWIENAAHEIGTLTAEKNAAYGNSVNCTGPMLSILFPLGIPPEKYGDMGLIVRILDKVNRIANQKEAFGESPYKDIAGYALMGYLKDEGK